MPRADSPECAEQEPEACSIVDIGCDAPAGYLIGGSVVDGQDMAEYVCDECWEYVCMSCSRALADGRRVCSHCADGERLAPEEYRPLPPAHPNGRKVMAKMCATCVFSPRSPVGPERMRDLEQQWQQRDTHQTCHHAGIGVSDDEEDGEGLEGEDIVCHGFFREVYLRTGTGQATNQ